MPAPSKILLKGSSVPEKVPALSSLELRELAINTSDGKIFTKTVSNSIAEFLNSAEAPFVLNQSLSSITPQFGSNNVSGVFGAVLNGFNNDVSGSGSTVANGENNDIASDFSFIGSGLNNSVSLTADYGAILGGFNNTLDHQNSFIIGSNISSHAENFTYVSNLSVLGKIYGDGSSLLGVAGGSVGGDENVNTLVKAFSAVWNIIGDRYFTTSISTNSINKGTKVFAVSANLSYIPTQDITIVHDHDINHHMHGTVLDYNSSTGSLTADITSHTGSGSYADWRINLGGTPTFVDSLVATNNLSDVANSATALANLSGVSKSELQSLSGSWQQTFTTVSSNSASWNYQGTDLKSLSSGWTGGNAAFTNLISNSAAYLSAVDLSFLSVSANWNSAYSTVNANSATAWNYQGTDLKSLSANWQNTSTVVQSNSAAWSSIRKYDMVYSPNTISYSGTAPSGSLTSQSAWTIVRIVYTTTGTVSSQGTANNAIWDNRLTVTYF